MLSKRMFSFKGRTGKSADKRASRPRRCLRIESLESRRVFSATPFDADLEDLLAARDAAEAASLEQLIAATSYQYANETAPNNRLALVPAGEKVVVNDLRKPQATDTGRDGLKLHNGQSTAPGVLEDWIALCAKYPDSAPCKGH